MELRCAFVLYLLCIACCINDIETFKVTHNDTTATHTHTHTSRQKSMLLCHSRARHPRRPRIPPRVDGRQNMEEVIQWRLCEKVCASSSTAFAALSKNRQFQSIRNRVQSAASTTPFASVGLRRTADSMGKLLINRTKIFCFNSMRVNARARAQQSKRQESFVCARTVSVYRKPIFLQRRQHKTVTASCEIHTTNNNCRLWTLVWRSHRHNTVNICATHKNKFGGQIMGVDRRAFDVHSTNN